MAGVVMRRAEQARSCRSPKIVAVTPPSAMASSGGRGLHRTPGAEREPASGGSVDGQGHGRGQRGDREEPTTDADQASAGEEQRPEPIGAAEDHGGERDDADQQAAGRDPIGLVARAEALGGRAPKPMSAPSAQMAVSVVVAETERPRISPP